MNDCCSINWTSLMFMCVSLFSRLNKCCSIYWTTLIFICGNFYSIIEQHFCVLISLFIRLNNIFAFWFCCSNDWTTFLLFYIFIVQMIEWFLFNQLNNNFCIFIFLLFKWLNDYYSINWTTLFVFLYFHCSNDGMIDVPLIEQHFLCFIF